MNKTSEKQFAATGGNESKEVPLLEQVRKEFEDAAQHGKAGRAQLMNELSEPHESLPLSLDSKDDASWANINVDQLGEAVGLVYQPEEPLNTIGRIEKRDENRWSMNPASAEDFDESSLGTDPGEQVDG